MEISNYKQSFYAVESKIMKPIKKEFEKRRELLSIMNKTRMCGGDYVWKWYLAIEWKHPIVWDGIRVQL